MSHMITFSDAAVSHIKSVMAKTVNSIGFRLSVKQTGCSGYMYVPEIIVEGKPGDIKIDTGRGLMVYIDPASVELINGTAVDYVQKDMGMSQLQFNNPNAEGLCGCGESFHLKGKQRDD